MMLVSDLVATLQDDVPAENSVPSETQYQRAVTEAIADFGRRTGRIKWATLNIVAGTATYDLPADFLKLINMVSVVNSDGVINSPQGLIPVPMSYRFCETYTYNGLTITIHPTPQYSLARDYRYKAGWALTVDSETGEYYDELTQDEADIALLLARVKCIEKKVNATGGGVLAYRIGDESFDKSGGVQSMISQQQTLNTEYLAACETYNGMHTVYGER